MKKQSHYQILYTARRCLCLCLYIHMVLLQSSIHKSKSCHAFSTIQITSITPSRLLLPSRNLPHQQYDVETIIVSSSSTRRAKKLSRSIWKTYNPMNRPTLPPSSTHATQLHLTTSTPTTSNSNKNEPKKTRIAKLYTLTGILSAIAWITTAYVALSFHPDPKFADCTMRHNLLTMSQAFAFPLPIAAACFMALRQCALSTTSNLSLDSALGQRLNLGLAVSSFWLAASSAFPTVFAFGYDLYSVNHKIAAAIIHTCTGLFALSMATRTSSIGQSIRRIMDSLWKLGPNSNSKKIGLENTSNINHSDNDNDNANNSSSSSLFATATVGLLYYTIQPIVSPYPLATIPTILGKRLSRPASAFTLLGTIVSYCLKKEKENETHKQSKDCIFRILQSGLAIGSGAHLLLLFMKIIGVDGGGLIFPGRGLWEVYPAMVNVPFAAGVSIAVYATCFAACFE
jgi:hypothetical protein